MKVFTIISPDKISNIYFVTDNKQEYGVIIDPGSFAVNVYQIIKNIGAKIKKIIITSSNEEQVAGIPVIKKIFDAEVFAKRSSKNLEFQVTPIKDGDIIKEGELEFKIMETPVSSYDAISIYIPEAIFVGNLLQAGTLSSIDKNQTPSEFELNIVRKCLLPLSDDTIIYPGKGPASTISIEKSFNPFFSILLNEDK